MGCFVGKKPHGAPPRRNGIELLLFISLLGPVVAVVGLEFGTPESDCALGGTKTALAPPTRPTKSMAFRGLWEISGVVKSVICFFRHLVVKVDGFPS